MTSRRCLARAGGFGRIALSVALFGLSGVARAEDSAADIAAARTFGTDGVTLADSGRCKEAIERLERAEKLHHAPTTAGRLGECEIEIGKVVLGTEILQRLLRDPTPPNAPPAFAVANARAQKVLQAALPKIAKLRVSVKAPPGTKFALTVDGEAISDVFIDNDRPTDPGAHTVEAKAQGFITSSAKVTVKEGESQSVALTLEVDPNAPVIVATPEPVDGAATGPSPVRRDEPPPAPKTAAYAALGVGALGVVIGTVTGALAIGKASTLSDSCPGKVCPPTRQSDLSSAKTLATVSTVGFIVGGVGLGAGLVLLFTGRTAPAAAQTGGVHVRPVLGGGYLGLDGIF